MKLIAALALIASLGGCVTHDYCAESHPIEYRQRSAEWEANYRMCRMMEVGMKGNKTPQLEVIVVQ